MFNSLEQLESASDHLKFRQRFAKTAGHANMHTTSVLIEKKTHAISPHLILSLQEEMMVGRALRDRTNDETKAEQFFRYICMQFVCARRLS